MAKIQDVMLGKTMRKSFAKHDKVLAIPNMLKIQKDSYNWFLDEGLREVFRDVDTITDYTGNLELSFLDYSMNEASEVHGRRVQGARRNVSQSPSRSVCGCTTRRPTRSRSRKSSWATSRS